MKIRTQFFTMAIITLVAVAGIIACGGDDPTPTPETFTVTFNANGGSPTPPVQTVEKGKTAEEPTGAQAPTKANNTLDGWYKEAALTTPWNFASDKVTANITLWAKWVETLKVPEDTPKTLTFDKEYSVTITSNDTFTAAEWETLCDDVVTALEAAYTNGIPATQNRLKTVFGRDCGAKIILEKNPTDYTNYKVAGNTFDGDYFNNELYLNVESIGTADYAYAILAMYSNNPDHANIKG